MRGSIAPTRWTLTEFELGYLVRSWTALLLGIVFAATGIGSSLGLVSASNARLRVFERTLEQAVNSGDSLSAALSRPVTITEDGQGGVLIDNPLRFDFEQAQASLTALHPLGFAINCLQVLTFLAVPLTAAILAMSLVSRDYRLGTLKVRSVRAPVKALQDAQFTATLVAVAGAALVAVGVAVVSGMLLRGSLNGSPDVIPAPDSDVATWAELARTAALCLGTGAFFVALGWGVGLALRQALLPAVAFVLWDLVCPLLGPFDPRSLWLVAASRTFSFRGSFELPPIAPLGDGVVVAALAAMGAASILVGRFVSGRFSRFT